MLFGRDAELTDIARRLDAARASDGSALVLRGDAGIGKTALLEATRSHADGVTVLAVCGTETETHLPYAGLLQLLEPLLARRRELPEPQMAALEGALALAASAPGDRFTVFVAVLGLVRLAAADGPLLLLVDDAQWLDAATAECIAFVARRLTGSRVLLLIAVRDGEPSSAGQDGRGGLPSMRLAPLAARDARALASSAAADLASPVRDAVVLAADGNPLALVEIAASLAPAERSGRAPLPDPLPAGGRVAAVFDRRVRALASSAREALLIAAAADGGDLDVLGRAWREAGLDRNAIEGAEEAALVHLADGKLRFSHPLVRTTAWQAATAPARRKAHRALAAVVDGLRRGWHLAEAAMGPDEEAAKALVEAAVHAAARRGYAEASAAYERAAALSEDVEQKARRLLRACNNCVAAGRMEKALAILDACIALGASVSFGPRTLHTRSLLLMGVGQVHSGLALLRSLADAAEGVADPAMAAYITADAGMAALLAGEIPELLELGKRATAILGDRGDALVKAQVGACLSAGLIFRGDAAEGRLVLENVERWVLDVHDQEMALRTHSMITHLRTALDDYEQAHAHATAVLGSLEEISAHAARCAPLGHAADAAHRLGWWDLAERQADETILIAEETANGDALPRALIVRARIAAARGQDCVARSLIDRAEASPGHQGNWTMVSYVATARGLLELSLGRTSQAIAALEQAAEIAVGKAGLFHPSILPWRPDLVEAYMMTGRIEEAGSIAAGLDAEAIASGSLVGLSLAARCSGLLAGADFEVHFERALTFEAARPMPFERARTLLLYGSRLHRARRRVEARAKLREAEQIFDGLGAVPWLDRCRAELGAAGARRRAAASPGEDTLTPQELRVATAVARGQTLREVAAELFLSPKTVDSHLRQVYAKLDIHSRARLGLIAAERGWID